MAHLPIEKTPLSRRIRQHYFRHIRYRLGAISVSCQRLRDQSSREFEHCLISRIVLGPIQVRALPDVWIEVRDEADEVRIHIQTDIDIDQVRRVELTLSKAVSEWTMEKTDIGDLPNQG